jgi:predicted deacetylase
MKLNTKLVLRVDDVCAGLNKIRVNRLLAVCIKHNVKPLFGVIPDNKDRSLISEYGFFNEEYLAWLKEHAGVSFDVAQHGLNHLYVTDSPGVLGISKKSEFSGLSYDAQYHKIEKGKEVLISAGIWQPIFMAPSHSFDSNTLLALNKLGFKFITDGYGLHSYIQDDLTFIPQMVSKPFNVFFGIGTVCLHLNSMSDEEFDNILEYVQRNSNRFVSIFEATKIKHPLSFMLRYFLTLFIKFSRFLRKMIFS